jgi:Asp-tRNA(Asn)/Glu-tRNA(Gln) amidotransferase A subunit family amidase
LPLAELDGLPLGVSIVARRGADLMLLGLARRLMAGWEAT